MVVHRAETLALLEAVEQSAQRKFQLRDDVAALVDLAGTRRMELLFEDVLFLAKFISNARNVLSRVGTQREETQKLSLEFKEQLEKVATLIRTLAKDAPDDWKPGFVRKYLSLEHESMANLLTLLEELSWLKNYSLDHERSRQTDHR